MHIICILIVLCLNVSYGHESCDRKEMEDTICSLCSQRKESFSGTFTDVGIFCLHLQLHSNGYELMLNFKNQMCLTFKILSKQEDF